MPATDDHTASPEATLRREQLRDLGPVQAIWLDDADEPPNAAPAAGARMQWVRGVRIDPGVRAIAALVAVGVVVAIVAAVVVFRNRPEPIAVPPLPPSQPVLPTGDSGPSATGSPSTEAGSDMVISVVGLVTHPGLLHLPSGSRVADAVAAAGGPSPNADLLSLNMAARLDDGDQVQVGRQPDVHADVPSGVRPGQALGSTASTGSTAHHPAVKVDLNTATEQQLDALPGVGPATAAAIVAWRTRHGRFGALDQLREIHGIGPAKLARLQQWVTW